MEFIIKFEEFQSSDIQTKYRKFDENELQALIGNLGHNLVILDKDKMTRTITLEILKVKNIINMESQTSTTRGGSN